MTISPKFSIGSIVYLRISPEEGGMVTGILIRPNNVVTYLVGFAGEAQERYCYDIELTTEKSFSSEP